MQTDDIAAWLTAIWDERQRACVEAQTAIDACSATAASGDLELRWMLQLRRGGEFQAGWDMPGPPTPTEDLARIAADRAILAECSIVLENKDPERLGERILAWAVVRQLASVHRDRPNWREAWQ